jgi:hypothetical protein
MNMTLTTRSAAADEIFDRFMDAVTTSRHDIAILLARPQPRQQSK